MIVTKLSGGLGNQMFQYAIGRTLALKNKTDLRLDLSYYPGQSLRSYALEAFAIKAKAATLLDRLYVRFWGTRTTEETLAFDPGVLGLAGTIYLDGYWQTEKYFIENRERLLEVFSLKKQFSPAAQEVLRDIESGKPSISVHVRRGDYVSNEKINSVHGTPDTSYYDRAAALAAQKCSGLPRFFIFSDDPNWCKDNMELPGETSIGSRPGISDAEELLLMSRCSHHIIANSSFSWWGAWLNTSTHKIVIAPKQWYREASREPRDIIPPSWIRI